MASLRYRVNVTRRGPPPRPFGWEVCRRDDGVEMQRSAETFHARHEAIADGERAARALDAQAELQP
jgi:hypothetical protein